MEPANIQKYKLADCTLFRTPPVDYSKIESTVEKALMEAWNRGYNAQHAVAAISSSEELLRQITGQIADSLRFQRQQAIEKVEAGAQAAVQNYGQQKSGQIAMIESRLGPIIRQRSDALNQKSSDLGEKRRRYDAVQSSIMRIRDSVNSKLGRIGGEQAYSTLGAIRKTVTAQRYAGTPTGALSGRIQGRQDVVYSPQGATTGVESQHIPDSLEEKIGQVPVPAGAEEQQESQPKPRKNLIQRFVLAVWDAFEKSYENYFP